MLAARIMVKGFCRAHRELSADPEKWTAEIRSAAAAATGEGAWVEKVRFQTAPETGGDTVRPGSDPLSDLIRYINGLSVNGAFGNWLAEELKPLREKLPPEISQGEGVMNLDSGEELKRVLEDVKGMLVQRILETDSKK